MKLTLAAAAALLTPLVAAQNYIQCNPLKKTCPPNPALQGSRSFDMKSPPADFSIVGKSPDYTPDGANFVIAKPGEGPTITSDFFIMYGRAEITLKSSSGKGIVSSAFLVSDVEDELDIEFLGSDAGVEFNWFRKGDLSDPGSRVKKIQMPGHSDEFRTYTIDWTPDRVEWAVNGDAVRTWTAQEAGPNFPQTPMRLRVGPWAGGDFDRNPQGTAEWAGGPVDYSQLPFTMSVKSIKVTNYSSGKEYRYTDNSGNLDSIEAVGGEINGRPGSGSPPEEVESSTPPKEEPTPAPTQGTPDPGPGPEPKPPTTLTTEVSMTSPTGLPSSHVISASTDSGEASEPSSAATTSPTSSSSPSSSDPSDSSDSPESTTAEPTETDSRPTTLIPTVSASSTGSEPSVPTAPNAASAFNPKNALGSALSVLLGLALF